MAARLVVAMFCLVGAFACAGDETTPLGQLWEACDNANLCAQGLVCLSKFCTVQCQANPVTCVQAGAGDTCDSGACFYGCSPTIPCPSDLVCTMATTQKGTCRLR
jgi:hypothetical protein